MIPPLLACLGLLILALLALLFWRDMLRAAPPEGGEVSWGLLVVQASTLALTFVAICVLSFGYAR